MGVGVGEARSLQQRVGIESAGREPSAIETHRIGIESGVARVAVGRGRGIGGGGADAKEHARVDAAAIAIAGGDGINTGLQEPKIIGHVDAIGA